MMVALLQLIGNKVETIDTIVVILKLERSILGCFGFLFVVGKSGEKRHWV
jgi:hypothetical protein